MSTTILENSSQSIQDKISFEKARFEYCLKVFEEEVERKEKLEKKVQFYLSFVSLLLGAIFLNLEYLLSLNDLIDQSTNPILFSWFTYFSLVGALASILLTLLTILKSIHLQKYISGYPSNVIYTLFAPDSDFMKNSSEAEFFKAVAMNYAIALDFNSHLNQKKSNWVRRTSLGVFFVVLFLTIFLLAVIYMSSFQ